MKKILSAFVLILSSAALLSGCAVDNRTPGATPFLPEVSPIITPAPNFGVTPGIDVPNQGRDLGQDITPNQGGALNGGGAGGGMNNR